jgi:hypothetical protein
MLLDNQGVYQNLYPEVAAIDFRKMGTFSEVYPQSSDTATCWSFSVFSVIPAKAEIQEEIITHQKM